MAGFDNVADFYSVFSDGEQRLKNEGKLLSELLRRAPGKRVIDIACGTSIHAQFFAESGAEVTALDLSREMIQRNKEERAHPSIRYDICDMRQISGGPWDLAICLGNSMSLLKTDEDIEVTFNSVSKCLAPGGLFAIQILNYSAENFKKPRHRIDRKNIGSDEIIAIKNLIPDKEHTLLSMAFYCRHSNGEYDYTSDAMTLKHINVDDLTDAANKANLIPIETYGGFDMSEFNARLSTDIIFIAVRNC